MNTDLQNKVVLITGASGGIGAEVARALAAEGCRLALHYRRNRRSAESLRRSLEPAKAAIFSADLRQEMEVARLFREVRRAFGRIDTLVANAGIWVEREAPLHRMTLRQWRQTIDTDLTSVFLCCREFLRAVKRQRQGNIVLVSSTAGVFGEAGHADYSAAKSAIAHGLTLSLKNEIARLAPSTPEYCGGRVNCVCPGWVVTSMTRATLRNRKLVDRVTSTMALRQIARPDDVANAIVYLASDRLARHVTGQTLVIAGGMEGRLLWELGGEA